MRGRQADATNPFSRFLRVLGPGLITGAADDDPSGIATYSQTGAQFGYGQLWIALFTLPLMTAIQEACARIGLVARRQGHRRGGETHYGAKMTFCVVLLVLVATVFIVREPWSAILRASLVPHIEFSFGFLFIITGVIGTTISPYMFFWEASEEVEETRERNLIDGWGRPRTG